jgi:hypothetical protein
MPSFRYRFGANHVKNWPYWLNPGAVLSLTTTTRFYLFNWSTKQNMRYPFIYSMIIRVLEDFRPFTIKCRSCASYTERLEGFIAWAVRQETKRIIVANAQCREEFTNKKYSLHAKVLKCRP